MTSFTTSPSTSAQRALANCRYLRLSRIGVVVSSALRQSLTRVLKQRVPAVHRGLSLLRTTAEVMAANARRIRHLEAKVEALELNTGSSEVARRRVLELIALIRPIVPDTPLIRIGRSRADGGYVVHPDFAGIDHAISLGIADDVSADLDLVEKGCRVHCYDPTIAALPVLHSSLTFFQQGVSAQAASGMVTLSTTVERIADAGDLFLKCDIEGHEWGVFASTPIEVLQRFRQITMEMHGFDHLTDDAWWARTVAALSALNETHRPIHVHASNYFPPFARGGIAVPRILEVSYLRRDFCGDAPFGSFGLSPLDVAHDPDFPETDLAPLWNHLLD